MKWNPTKKYRKLVSKSKKLLKNEKRTVRRVYYALEARGYDYDYKQVKRGLKLARLSDMISPSKIEDTSRSPACIQDKGYDSPQDFFKTYKDLHERYEKNFWMKQPNYIEVWLEKAALAPIFKPICKKYNVRLVPIRGDWSVSKIYRTGQRLIREMEKRDALETKKQTVNLSEGGKNSKEVTVKDKCVKILYFGDFNPSGYHDPVAIQHTMQEFGIDQNRDSKDEEKETENYFKIDRDGVIDFERVAINFSHIKKFDLPKNANPSSSDKDRTLRERFKKYVSDGRDINIELDALAEYERKFLEDLIEDKIKENIDMEAKEDFEKKEQEEKQEIKEKWKKFERDLCEE